MRGERVHLVGKTDRIRIRTPSYEKIHRESRCELLWDTELDKRRPRKKRSSLQKIFIEKNLKRRRENALEMSDQDVKEKGEKNFRGGEGLALGREYPKVLSLGQKGKGDFSPRRRGGQSVHGKFNFEDAVTLTVRYREEASY